MENQHNQSTKEDSAKYFDRLMLRNIVILRTAREMTQIDLARQCGWETSKLIDYESGRKFVPWSDAIVLARALGVPVGLFKKDIAYVFHANNGVRLPELLRDLRVRRRLTQAQISEQLNMPKSAYNDIESGKNLADPQTMISLAELLCQMPKTSA